MSKLHSLSPAALSRSRLPVRSRHWHIRRARDKATARSGALMGVVQWARWQWSTPGAVDVGADGVQTQEMHRVVVDSAYEKKPPGSLTLPVALTNDALDPRRHS
ncbi:hypothetical protein DOTSEDRAFT_32134 [Dothistroma septosporum NZE10]|uniref:Uncharacterized protein n=1 Tax=Dothistroma septosporum (strain NZE10 / CBS 128990) TaxID=675120 RepID=N1PZV3_DOTSN|nr:hypothetical protein DOTSEDRAFT_32134 [Dothistroma septosporum NZE10]